MTELTDEKWVKLQKRTAYWNKQFDKILKKDTSGKRRRKVWFTLQAHDLACNIADGIEKPKKTVVIPKKAQLDQKTVEKGVKWQKMLEKEAFLILNNL